MDEYFIKTDEICSIFKVMGEADLKLRPGLNLNAPPADGKCQCCGRHITELKPFGNSSDPLFCGAFLIKIFRPEWFLGPAQLDVVYESSERLPDDPNVWVVPSFEFFNGCEVSWECCDCVGLNNTEYFKKKWPESEKAMKQSFRLLKKLLEREVVGETKM